MNTEEAVQSLVADLDYPMLIVTTAAVGERSGCLVGFSTQCSIDPPRFIVCLSNKNRTYRVAQHAAALAVHFLTQADRELSELFGEKTGDTADKFAAARWQPGPDGIPLLLGGAGYYVGEILQRHDVGDHGAFVLAPTQALFRGARGPQLGFQDVKDMEPGHEA